MPVSEITSYIGNGDDPHPTPLTLKRNDETGYFQLENFLPLLKQLHENRQSIDNTELRADLNNKENITSDLQNTLLSKFGVLVDTDSDGEKWITGDKAFHILDMLKILHLFKDKIDGKALEQKQETKPNNKKENEDEKIKPSTSQHIDANNGSGNIAQGQENRNIAVKRSNDMDYLSLESDSNAELGSPLKKMKANPTQLKNNGEDNRSSENSEKEHDLTKAITTFHHDLSYEILKMPLSIHQTQPTITNVENEQRMKLEAFLQRLLFPDVQGSGDSDLNAPSFERILEEVNANFSQAEFNLNIPVDEHGNTPLHWLTSIANLNLVKDLVKHGANRLLGDNSGESALVKAVKSVNNYDSGTFEELLDYLYPCLLLKDSMDRTILHHIIITSGMAGCSAAAKYYLDILMGWIVKKQTRPTEGAGPDAILENLDLKWVIINMLNAQDSNGDTCLNIAARLGNAAVVDSLLDYGADPYIANKSGLRPVDFGAGTSKLQPGKDTKETSIKAENGQADIVSTDGNQLAKEPDTMSLINDMKTLLATVSKDYESELTQYKDKLDGLHKNLNSQREQLATARDRLSHAKQLRDEYALLKEQLTNIQRGIEEEEENFRQESKSLGISAEETAGIDWESGEFDADEPFRVDIVYRLLENKLANEYGGDIEKLLNTESVDTILKQVQASYPEGDDALLNMLPPSVLLKARVNAYKRNDEHLAGMLSTIKQRQTDLEGKFRRVLSLCLKIDEEKVDGMLDGLLQAISSEDPQDIDTGEMQDFLNRHAT